MQNISQVSLGLVVLLNTESSRHIGISEEAFVKAFISIFLLLDFCSHCQLFLTGQCIALRKKKVVCLQEMKCQKRLGVKSACSKRKFS